MKLKLLCQELGVASMNQAIKKLLIEYRVTHGWSAVSLAHELSKFLKEDADGAADLRT